jgi:hypothetical protein
MFSNLDSWLCLIRNLCSAIETKSRNRIKFPSINNANRKELELEKNYLQDRSKREMRRKEKKKRETNKLRLLLGLDSHALTLAMRILNVANLNLSFFLFFSFLSFLLFHFFRIKFFTARCCLLLPCSILSLSYYFGIVGGKNYISNAASILCQNFFSLTKMEK